ncbi:MAG: tetratricopeptide repeat protein, partial [Gemmataceae bacterium]|nr:tetratricopeptide repeat protein [Gemmataceae bacterium]
ELDSIVMKCLEKDRSRRYETANGLAMDVQRYLADEPVEARPASAWYRLRKAYRRNRAVLTTAAGFAALLILGLVLVTWKWQDERAARADADAARRDAENKAREIQEGAERMNAASAAMDLAGQHVLLGQWAAAEAEFTRAIDLRPDHSQVWMRRGDFYGHMGLWELAAEDHARSFACRPPDMVRHWYFHALLQFMQGDEAAYRRICRQMMDRFGASSGGFNRGNLIRACSLSPGTVADFDRLPGSVDNMGIANVYKWVPLYCSGVAHYRAGRFKEAINDLRKSLARTDYHARAMNFPVLAMALHRSGQTDAARQELDNSRKQLGRWMDAGIRVRGRPVQWASWYDWAEFQVYHAEAHRLIEGSPPPEDPRLHVLRGWAFAGLGRTDRAAPEYQRAVQLAPNEYGIRLAAFRFHADSKRWPDAKAELIAMKRLRPRDAGVSVEAFRSFADNGNRDRAAAEHAAAVKLNPDDLRVLLERHRYHHERGEPKEAAAAYVEATRDRANDIPFRIKLGDVCAGVRLWATARGEYARILDAGILGDGELNRNAWLRLAVLQLYLGDVDDYRRTCARLVERHGADDDWRTMVALIRLCLLHPDPGVDPARLAELGKRLTGTGDNPSMGVHAAAIISLRLGKNDVDLQALRAALKKYQWDTQRVALARVLHANGDYFSARNLMNQVRVENRKVDPTTGSTGIWDINLETQLWYRQAEAVIQSERWRAVDELVKQRQWAAAVDAFGPLLTPENKSARDWGVRGGCLAELGRWKEAAADSARANSLAPDYLPGVLKHAILCLRVGDRDRYRELCRRALEGKAKASERTVLNNVAWLCALDGAAEEQAVQALALVEKALDKTPNNTFVHTRACLLYRVGRYDDALKQLNELVAQPGYPVNAYDWLFLAMTHQKLGQPEQARKNLDRSVAWMVDANRRLDWQRRAELEHFRSEAAALIGAKK